MTKGLFWFSVSCVWRHTEKQAPVSLQPQCYTYFDWTEHWKDVSVRFAAHEASTFHRGAVLKTITILATVWGELLSAQQTQDRHECGQSFLKPLSNVKFLTRQALPLSGTGNKSHSNYIQHLTQYGKDNHRILRWIEMEKDRCILADMHKAISKIFLVSTGPTNRNLWIS